MTRKSHVQQYMHLPGPLLPLHPQQILRLRDGNGKLHLKPVPPANLHPPGHMSADLFLLGRGSHVIQVCPAGELLMLLWELNNRWWFFLSVVEKFGHHSDRITHFRTSSPAFILPAQMADPLWFGLYHALDVVCALCSSYRRSRFQSITPVALAASCAPGVTATFLNHCLSVNLHT